MTPLIRKAVTLSPEPETAMWFDVGQMDAKEKLKIPAEIVMNLPFKRTGIVGLDTTGKDFALWLTQGAGSVTVAGCSMWHKKYFEPYAYLAINDGFKIYKKDKEISLEDVKPVHRMVLATLSRLANISSGYTCQPQKTFINRKRQLKGKPALSFDWVTVEIGDRKEKNAPQGGTHASPRLHDRRGHWRIMKATGKKVWVKQCKVGDASKGVVFKDYKLKEKNT